MNKLRIKKTLYLFINFAILVAHCRFVKENDGNLEQGLYEISDKVDILTGKTIESKLTGNEHAYLVQFYNRFCGHCQIFSSYYKNFSRQVESWRHAIRIGVIDCSEDENVPTCRDFGILSYPTLRYYRERLPKDVKHVNDTISRGNSTDELKANVIRKMESEQLLGHMKLVPPLQFYKYQYMQDLLQDIPSHVLYTFVIFEEPHSILGAEIIIETYNYEYVNIKRINSKTSMPDNLYIENYPALVLINHNKNQEILKTKDFSKDSFLKAINLFLKDNNYVFPIEPTTTRSVTTTTHSPGYNLSSNNSEYSDRVFYNDLEMAVKKTLRTEIVRYKVLENDQLEALINYLDTLLDNFPFRYNLGIYIRELRNVVGTSNKWTGGELFDKMKSLEGSLSDIYSDNVDYVNCKGSQSIYRGYTCGLWQLFHTLTIGAADQHKGEGAKVLKAIHGYVKYFFGCTDCSEHFQAMAKELRMDEVKGEDEAVIWLWQAHNKVNLRLAGTQTEDPEFPKIQFPSRLKCPLCRSPSGDWNVSEVYKYLKYMYGREQILEKKGNHSLTMEQSPFSSVDIGLLSFLYIISFIILILVIKVFITKRYNKKRNHRHGRGKV